MTGIWSGAIAVFVAPWAHQDCVLEQHLIKDKALQNKDETEHYKINVSNLFKGQSCTRLEWQDFFLLHQSPFYSLISRWQWLFSIWKKYINEDFLKLHVIWIPFVIEAIIFFSSFCSKINSPGNCSPCLPDRTDIICLAWMLHHFGVQDNFFFEQPDK